MPTSRDYPSDLTDRQWRLIKRLLPPWKGRGRRPHCRRLIFNAILYVTRTSCQWRQLWDQIPGRVDHSTAGAQHAQRAFPEIGRLLAYLIAGHHAGLAHAEKLDGRITKEIEPIGSVPPELLEAPKLGLPGLTRFDPNQGPFQLAFFTRMLFGALVDVDFLEFTGESYRLQDARGRCRSTI